jgi:hypothetical protein
MGFKDLIDAARITCDQTAKLMNAFKTSIVKGNAVYAEQKQNID